MLYRTTDKSYVCEREGTKRTGDSLSLKFLLKEGKYKDFKNPWPWHMLEESTLVVPKEFL